jgi:hypothetical protein
LILCGGGTERRYFEFFVRQRRLGPIVSIEKNCEGLDPKSVVELAVKRKAENARDVKRGEAAVFDAIWCVLDMEGCANRPPTADAAKDQARHHRILLVWSAPCFEFWYLLHFEYTSAPFANCDAVIQRLKQHLPDYEKSGEYSEILDDLTQTAIDNARKIAAVELSSSYTEVYKLIEFLNGLD